MFFYAIIKVIFRKEINKITKQLTQEDIDELMYMHGGGETDLHMLENGAEDVEIFDSIDEFLNSEILEEIHEENRRDSIYEDEMDNLALNELDYNQKNASCPD